MIYNSIKKLVQYGLETGLVREEDRIYTINRLLELFGEEEYEEPEEEYKHVDLEETLKELEKYPSEDIFIAGGEEIYREFLPYCDVAHITYIDYTYEADTFFPDLEQEEDWKMLLASEEQTYFDLCYEFRLYRRTGRKIPAKNSPDGGK